MPTNRLVEAVGPSALPLLASLVAAGLVRVRLNDGGRLVWSVKRYHAESPFPTLALHLVESAA
jgi:hypothetical protein